MSDSILQIEKLGRTTCIHCGEVLEVSEFHIFEEIECPVCGGLNTVPGRFNNYYLLRELGQGGMGTVFLARDAQLNRQVALKVLNPKFGKDPNFVEALLKEAKAAAALNHKNIVHIYSFGQEKNQPYIVMELVDGIRLDECIDSETHQDEIGWLDVLYQIAQGLSDAEKKGVIHGDIKPANILMNPDGSAKLSDFGIARVGGEHDDRILGTPLYIAPEKSRGEKVDARSDQFSLGATFWHILSGYPPFPGKSSKEVVLQRFKDPAPDIKRVAPYISFQIGLLLQKMMATEPEDRFPNFDAVVMEIEEILLELEAYAYEEESRREQLEEQAHQIKHQENIYRSMMVGAVILVLIIGFIYLAFYM
jgi:serine/threonine-protein kinase